jgi:hypothetical protein
MEHRFSLNDTLHILRPKDQLSDDPLDYGLRRYTDLDIAEHAILIENIPKDTPNKQAEE